MKKRLVPTSFGAVAVYESSRTGRPVLLIHGNSLSSESFFEQLSRGPGKRHRLIAFDLPGHGFSPRSTTPEKSYRFGSYAKIVDELLRSYGLGNPVLVGHSLGGHIALEAAAAGLRLGGLMVIGTPPISELKDFPEAFCDNLLQGMNLKGNLSAREASRFAAAFSPEGQTPPPYYARSILHTDPAARDILGISIAQDPFADEVAVLRNLHCPAAIVLGEHDRVVNSRYIEGLSIRTLWKGGMQRIDGGGHCPQYDSPRAFNRLLMEFLEEPAA